MIENRGGAGGAIGVDAIVKSAPDGYVIGIPGLGALAVDVILNDKLPYDTFRDIAPISGLIQSPFIMAAPLTSSANSIRDVIARAKADAKSLSIGNGGNGTAMHLTAQLCNHMAGVEIALVPYRGTGPVMQDVLAGHIPLGITDPPSAIAQIEARRIKALAISSGTRFPALPDIPTFAECPASSRPAGSASSPGPHTAGDYRETECRDRCGARPSGCARAHPRARRRADAGHAGVRSLQRIREVGQVVVQSGAKGR